MNHLQYEIHNLEASIMYIQEEHATTLKLLHEEIKLLQMKNSELSFRITMDNIGLTDVTNNGLATEQDNKILLSQIEKLKEEVKKLNIENESKLFQLQNYKGKVLHLSGSIERLQESQKIQLNALEMELNNKSAEIVILTTKLHKWKKLEIIRTSPDNNTEARSPRQILDSKVLKFQSPILIHTNQTVQHQRPIISHHTTLSNSLVGTNKSVPWKSRGPVSLGGQVNFSKSIRKLSILPPISPIRRCYGDYMISSKTKTENTPVFFHDTSSCNSFQAAHKTHDTNSHLNPSNDMVNIDCVMDINNSSQQLSSQTRSEVFRNH